MTKPYQIRPMPADFPNVALTNGVTAIQCHYKASYNAVMRWLGELPLELQEARRVMVPKGRTGGQPAPERDDTTNINASDKMAKADARQGSEALLAGYVKAAKRNGWRVWEYAA